MSEPRCSNCGALVSEDAEWCGQCFASLRVESEPEPEAPASEPEISAPEQEPEQNASIPTGEDTEEAPKKAPFWACPICQNENELDSTLCPVCGTPFGRLFEEPDENPRIPPDRAALYGLLPGYGHLKCGRAGEAVARMFFALGSLAITTMFAFTADAGAVSMVLTALFACLLLFSVGESAVDARRLASGERELITGRQLLWVFIGAFGLAVLLVVFLSIGQTPSVGGG